MSKKKGVSTMSLKDFHGGSIPSDLPLPSAPGVMSRTTSDRNALLANWENNSIRTDLRPRPKSSGASRGFDDRASFLSHPAPLGRNFDEDERKPFDAAVSHPRRTIIDDGFRNLGARHQESKPDYLWPAMRVSDRPSSSPPLHSPTSGVTSLSPSKHGGGIVVVHGNKVVDGSRTPSVVNGEDFGNDPPNVWGVKKAAVGSSDVGNSSSVNTVSKFAQVSALEKVSSGMWQTKNPGHLSPLGTQAKDNIATQSSHVGGETEKGGYAAFCGSTVDNGGGKELPTQEKAQVPTDELATRVDNVVSLTSALSGEISERPKLKLLPRSRPLETSENDYRQGYQQATELGKNVTACELPQTANTPNPGLAANTQTADKPAERPKLNLKPRSQPQEMHDGSLDKERNTLFGGGRPRELVLKERGADDIAINNSDRTHPPDRKNASKNMKSLEQSVSTTRYSQKIDNNAPAPTRRIAGDSERKDQWVDHENAGVDRRNWRNDRLRNSQDTKDPRPEPETWRKPVEEPKAAAPDFSGICHGKLVSAVDLAQIFSKSVSDPRSLDDAHAAQRSLPTSNKGVPFSRLTASPTRH